MNETQVQEDLAPTLGDAPVTSAAAPTPATDSQVVVPAQACSSCGAAPARLTAQTVPDPWVYVIGHVDSPRFPSLAIEKEAIGAMSRVEAARGLSNEAALQAVLGMPQYAYLVREMCFVLLIQGIETYLLVPRVPSDYPMLVEAARSEFSVVVGRIGPIAGPEACNGLTVPYLVFDVIYNFDKAALISNLPLPEGFEEARFRTQATDIFNQAVTLISSGRGMERALVYLMSKDSGLYEKISRAFNQNAQLTSIELKAAPVNSTQNLTDVIVCTTDRRTGAPSYSFARIALGSEYPFVASYWQPYLGKP